MSAATTLAVGGERTVPSPDAAARDYLLLALRLGQRVPGPGDGLLRDRLAALDESLTVPHGRLPPIADWLVARFRQGALIQFGLPAGEGLRVGLVRDQPWSGYNWYDGGFRSRVDLNVDLPI